MSIIGINGHIGVGKDLTAMIIKKLDVDSNWEIKKFAFKLKQIASILTGIPAHKFESQEFKKTYLGKEWNYNVTTDNTILVDGKPKHAVNTVNMTVRDMLQKLGTEAMRNGLHPDTWVNALMCDYKKVKDKDEEYSHPNWIITDVRFPNEYDAIKSKGGIIIRVNRNESETNDIKHISETALDGYHFDYVINNNSDINNLTLLIEVFLKQYHNNENK